MKRHMLILILGYPFLLFGCALLMIWMPLPQPFSPALSGTRNRMAAIVIGLLGVAYVAGLGIYAVLHFLRAGRVLDPTLTAKGLTARGYALFGRRYRGEIEGREVEAIVMPAQGIRPAQLNITVQAVLGTRMAMGRKRPLLGCRGCTHVEGAGAAWDGYHIYAEDRTLALRLLNDPVGREHVGPRAVP